MKIGDTVFVTNDSISGEITSLDGDVVIIVSEDGFEMEFSPSELVVVEHNLLDASLGKSNFSNVISEKEDFKKNPKRPIKKSKERNVPPMEVDLHIHQLVKHHKGMNNYDMLTIQLDTAKRQLDFAIQKRIQRVVFIHGIGEGVLRAELEFLLKRYDNLKFYDADYQKYGQGATEVYIYQNNTT